MVKNKRKWCLTPSRYKFAVYNGCYGIVANTSPFSSKAVASSLHHF